MIEIGRINTLKVDHVDESGVWMEAGEERVLLPKKEAADGCRPGDPLSVFITRDAGGRAVATLRRPKAQVGEFALLRVSEVTKHGAFLDWGLEKDLLVPYSEQPERMRAGRRYLVKVCLDSLGRVVGTARIDRCLETEEIDLRDGDEVELTLWQFTDLGVKVIVNDLYGGLVYKDEIRSGLKRGDRFRGYVKRIREDRKIDVALRKVGGEGVEEAKTAILAALQDGGFLPLHDRSSPEEIQLLLGQSKKMFKKAVGGLYKAGVVELTGDGIRLKKA
ncbi:S1-like domain-containing RNA-binding protein [uncultured Desulfuromonas sp.]|uniref:CvfB family protein n=1 Tax=uncultured Desulfuromonas sp. TaxID=181013 RepID=UPI00260D32C4|nr:S1-like domain-containing RNA-binding protein [uncultured Desulfuromonas sp.]